MDIRAPYIDFKGLRSIMKKLLDYYYLTNMRYERAKSLEFSVRHSRPWYPVDDNLTLDQIVTFIKNYDRREHRIDHARLRSRKAQARFEKTWNLITYDLPELIEEKLSTIFTHHGRFVPHLIERIAVHVSKYPPALLEETYQATIRSNNELLVQVRSTQRITEDYIHDLHIAQINNEIKQDVLNYCDIRKIILKRRIRKIEGLLRSVEHRLWKAKQNE